MNGIETLYPVPQIIGQMLVGSHLVSEQRVAAHRGDRDAIERSGRWRDGHKAPITVENLRKYTGRLISISLDSSHLRVLVDVPKKRILTDVAKVLTERH